MHYRIDGLRCAGCVARLERAVAAMPGVQAVRVDLLERTCRIDPGPGYDAPAVLACITAAGFGARPMTEPARADADPLRAAVVAGVLAALCMGVAMTWHQQAWASWVAAALAATTLAWPGRALLRRAAGALVRRAPDMDLLIALGALSAFAAGCVALATGWQLAHFDSSAAIIAFTLAGRAIEARGRTAAGAAVAALVARTPRTAERCEADGSERTVPVDALRPGDRIRVRPGGMIAADGVVAEGASEVDEGWFTGEALPVLRGVGEAVRAGSLLINGTLVVAVTEAGDGTALARTIGAMREAQGAKPPMARLADRIAAVFVPVVIGLAGATAAAWWLAGAPHTAVLAGCSVLVIACPCALGLATPAALAVAVGRAARQGVLVRDGAVIEALAACDVVALDKTGTCTAGTPTVIAVEPAPGVDRDQLLRLAAAAEAGSEHPLAVAVRAAASGQVVPDATAFVARPGIGVTAQVGAAVISVERDAAADGTVAVVLRGGVVLGRLRFEDVLRPDAVAAVTRLRALGLRPVLVTGDSPGAAQAAARTLGIASVHARQAPADKAAVVAALRRDGHRVLAVGDGINDAPLLAAAAAGAAVGGRSDIAALAGGLVLDARRPLSACADAVALARAARRTMRGNLLGAAVYNLAALPLAMTGHVDPMWASAAMAASSLTVLANSLRLRLWKP